MSEVKEKMCWREGGLVRNRTEGRKGADEVLPFSFPPQANP